MNINAKSLMPITFITIIERDFLHKIGMHQRVADNTMTAFGLTIPMQKSNTLSSSYLALLEMYPNPGESFFVDAYNYSTQILESKYEKVDMDEVVEQQTHLYNTQK
jgi:hypothetical protein